MQAGPYHAYACIKKCGYGHACMASTDRGGSCTAELPLPQQAKLVSPNEGKAPGANSGRTALQRPRLTQSETEAGLGTRSPCLAHATMSASATHALLGTHLYRSHATTAYPQSCAGQLLSYQHLAVGLSALPRQSRWYAPQAVQAVHPAPAPCAVPIRCYVCDDADAVLYCGSDDCCCHSRWRPQGPG